MRNWGATIFLGIFSSIKLNFQNGLTPCSGLAINHDFRNTTSMKLFFVASVVTIFSNYAQSCWPTVPSNGPGSNHLFRSTSKFRDLFDEVKEDFEKYIQTTGGSTCKVSDLQRHNFKIQVKYYYNVDNGRWDLFLPECHSWHKEVQILWHLEASAILQARVSFLQKSWSASNVQSTRNLYCEIKQIFRLYRRE